MAVALLGMQSTEDLCKHGRVQVSARDRARLDGIVLTAFLEDSLPKALAAVAEHLTGCDLVTALELLKVTQLSACSTASRRAHPRHELLYERRACK